MEECVDRWRGLRNEHLKMRTIVQFRIALLLESKLVKNKEQSRSSLAMHYDLNEGHIIREIKIYFVMNKEKLDYK